METEEKNLGGRPPHKPSPAKRAEVVRLVAIGCSKEMIAREIKIDAATLNIHYGKELCDGRILYRKTLVKRLDKESANGNVAATKALLAATAGPLPDEGGEQDAVAPPTKLGKKETAQIRAEAANTGRYATPQPPKTVLQ